MRGLLPWNPYRELVNWHRDIDELFNRFFSTDTEEKTLPMSGWMPRTEAFEKDGRYVLRLDLPGVDPKDIDLSVANNNLVIKGERRQANEVKEKGYHYTETAYGRFERSFALPPGVNRDQISAKYEHGVLEIAVPIPESVTAKKVPIEIGGPDVKRLQAA